MTSRWASTMNTSTPEMTGVSGLADVEALARLANQMFKALPVAESFPAIAQSGTAFPMPSALGGVGVELPSNPLPGLPPVGSSIPGEDKLRALLAPLLSPSTQVLPPVAAQAEPSYYFLRQEGSGSFENGLNSAPFDVHAVRRDFPILNETVNGRPLIWLDNAATTQKPKPVIDRLVHFYSHENSNIHRAAHDLAARATDAYESGRETVRRFLNAASSEEIVFVRGATEAINLVAQSWGRKNIGEGDEIVITWLEHHANIVPWQQLCAETGARLHIVPVDDSGQIRLDEYERILGPRTKLVSLTQVSNALGTVTPAQEMTALAKRQGAHVLIDGAQSVSHMPVDVQALGCDRSEE
ncbi:MAG: aminotransferase class V-fold PLP-dependent enzyme, partial [Rhodospirillales bacterium]